MLGMLTAIMMFVSPVVHAETGKDYPSMAVEKLCAVMGGKIDGYVYTKGGNKDAKESPAKVPYCTAGPSTLVEGLLRDKGVID